MPKRAAGLTARRVATEKRPGAFADGGGLYLQVAPSGAKSWIFRYQLAGRRRDMGLGSVSAFTLAEARERATDAFRQVARGIDPIDARLAERSAASVTAAKTITFSACAQRYIEAHQTSWRNEKHRYQWRQTVESYMNPTLGPVLVQAVDVGLVMKAIEPLWTAKPETASRVRGRIESILDWAAARGFRQGENPARWRGHLENLLPKKSKVRQVEHYAALPYGEIGAFMAELRQRESIAGRALEFAILTAARTGEVLKARWGEFNISERLWIIPAERMKAGKEHRVPLSGGAMAIIDTMAEIRTGDYVFPGASEGRPFSNMALLMLLRRMGRDDLTTHGFRSTFSDWCAERTTFAAEVREMALAHAVGDKVEAAYRRGDLFDKRRQLAEAWAKFCAGAMTSRGEIVQISRAGARQ
jgi:integrase